MFSPDSPLAPAADDPRPWERPGAVRRDCERHRGQLLRRLGGFVLVCAALAVCALPLALVVLPSSVAVWLLARRDLARMDAGLMDPEGWNDTDQGRIWTADAVWVSLPPLLLVALGLFLCLVG